MTVQEMKERKRELGYTNEMLAAQSGVPLGTVQKVFAGTTKAPRRETLLALEKALFQEPEKKSCKYPMAEPDAMAVHEEAVACMADYPGAPGDPRQGTYTLDDYYALPDERRVELIDGVIYDMSCPLRVHQAILGQLHLQLAPCVEAHPECELFFAPADVRLDNDNRTMVQPDLYIVCGKEETDKRRLNGAPDFVIEILSPSNRAHDMIRKLNKYHNAGVREDWIVDPEKLRVMVYDFTEDIYVKLYTFEDTIPVLISQGESSVDFRRILEKVRKYL